MKHKLNLIWIDLEMTGLSPEEDVILEIATVVTDASLNILDEGPVFAIHQPVSRLNAMDAWNTHQHQRSGLTQRVLESRITMEDAEAATLTFLKKYVDPKQSPMCGNTICQDRRFLARYMPTLEQFFHYRHIDVSTLKELALRWAPHLLTGLQKTSQHLALADIKDSIEELRYYRDHFGLFGRAHDVVC